MNENDDYNIKKDKVIKITNTSTKSYSPLKERAYKKLKLKVDRHTSFNDPIVVLTDEQDEKFAQFRSYCHLINKCIYCQTFISLENFGSNDDNEITALCADCLNYMVDGSSQAKDYVIWFDNIIKDYGMTFKDGFPKMMQHVKKGKWCKNCNAYHTKMEFMRVENL